MKNKYLKRSKISEAKFRFFLKCFAEDLTATQLAHLTSLNRNTVNRLLFAIRTRMAEHCDQTSPVSGQVEALESYFGARRVKGKRGRGAFGKTIVFGLLKRNGKVYTQIVPNVSRATLQAIIKGKVRLKSSIHSDKWKGYNGLVDLGYKKHYRLDHSRNEFAKGKSHINGIEGFWGYAKTRMVKFKAMPKQTFSLHLKETEFRYNYRHENLYLFLLKLLKNPSLF